MSGKPIDAEDIAVLLRLQAALPNVGLNGWFEGVRVLARVIEHLTAAQQQGQAQGGGEVVAHGFYDPATGAYSETQRTPRWLPAVVCTAPPSAPVGVEAIAAEIRASLGRGATVCTRRRWAIELEALAQQPAASDSWRDAFVAERARRYRDGGMKIEQARIHAESDADLAIALATQHQEPKS